jgi:hypothetical protein
MQRSGWIVAVLVELLLLMAFRAPAHDRETCPCWPRQRGQCPSPTPD